MPDWRDELLERFSFPRYERTGRNATGWPGYTPAQVVRYGIGEIGGVKVVACVWDFSAYGGSFGELDATAFAEACELAASYREPLVSFTRTGGTRLQEGNAALVGIARSQLALRRLAAAGVPHVAVVDHPTTGGVLVGVVSRADLRLAVEGATIGFAGPRVVEAVTGRPLPEDSHTAASARDAGVVDEVVTADAVRERLGAVLALVRPDPGSAEVGPEPSGESSYDDVALPERDGAQQVAAARALTGPSGTTLLDALLPGAAHVRAAGGDDTVTARLGRLGDATRVVAVALAAAPGTRPTVGGYRVLVRAAALAGRLGIPLVTLVDTPGAEPSAPSEAAGIGSAIADGFDAVLGCASPTVGVLVGEGGSGGALAGLVADRVLVTPEGYLAALGAEGAAVALRVPVEVAADRLALRPADLLRLGLADRAVHGSDDVERLGARLAAEVSALQAIDPAARRAQRERRWSAPLPGSLA